MTASAFPRPWRVIEHADQDASGQTVGFYFRTDPGSRTRPGTTLTGLVPTPHVLRGGPSLCGQ
jgi:hypothetical protein